MSTKMKTLPQDGEIDKIVRNSFGFSLEECLKEFNDAQENSKFIPDLEAPSNGYERLKGEIELKGILSSQAADKVKRKVRIKNIWKVALAATLIGCLVWGIGVAASAGKYYKYNSRLVEKEGNKIVWNNADNLSVVNSEVEAYKVIRDQFGGNVLKLSYIPEGMKYLKLDINEGFARIEFEYGNHKIYLDQMKNSRDSSEAVSSDNRIVETISNEWLGVKVPISQNVLDNGEIEYTAEFGLNDAHYRLFGVVEKKYFIKIVEGLEIYK